jgi:hypothetical protein
MVQQVLARGGVYVKYTTGYPVWRMESPGSFYGSSSELLARLNTLPVPLQHLRQVHQCLEAQRDTPTLLALLLLCEAYLALRLAPDTGKADNAEPALAGVVEQLGWAFSDDEIGSVPASLRDTQTRAEVAGRHPLLPPGFVSTHPTLAQDVHREWGSADAGQVKIVLDLLSDTPTLQQVALAYSALRKRLPK